jgi:hypothetical protein
MKLTPETVSAIKSCNGVYTLADTARHFNVAKPTVQRMWEGEVYGNIRPDKDAPNIERTTFPAEWLRPDISILRARGYTLAEIAGLLNISLSTVNRHAGGEL